MRVGILGGTFNPPHIGHLRLAEEAASLHQLVRILFIPSYISPHKGAAGIAPSEHRLEMTRLACLDNPGFHVSDMEIVRQSPSYTVNTLEQLRKAEEFEPFFILGTDSLKEIGSWKDYRRLFVLANFIVVTRPGVSFQEAWAEMPRHLRDQFIPKNQHLVHSSANRLIPSPVSGLNISATRIRSLIKSGQSVRYLVPEAVRMYIMKHHLYRN